VQTKEDLKRDLIKSENGKVMLNELGFELPNNNKKAEISTVEGIFS